jgi:hypothetical protein
MTVEFFVLNDFFFFSSLVLFFWRLGVTWAGSGIENVEWRGVCTISEILSIFFEGF